MKILCGLSFSFSCVEHISWSELCGQFWRNMLQSLMRLRQRIDEWNLEDATHEKHWEWSFLRSGQWRLSLLSLSLSPMNTVFKALFLFNNWLFVSLKKFCEFKEVFKDFDLISSSVILVNELAFFFFWSCLCFSDVS